MIGRCLAASFYFRAERRFRLGKFLLTVRVMMIYFRDLFASASARGRRFTGCQRGCHKIAAAPRITRLLLIALPAPIKVRLIDSAALKSSRAGVI